MRRPLIIGNWKLNGSKKIANELISYLRKELIGIEDCDIVIAPPIVYLHLVKQALISISNIDLGAQNVDVNLSGAFTGEISVNMMRDIGVKYIIVGHSERRRYHNESNEVIAQKFLMIKNANLVPVLCVGETEKEHIRGKTNEICAHQINAILKIQGVAAFRNAVIAYEPIWAIGTGKSATPLQAQTIHKFIREYLAEQDTTVAKTVIILYGGSINDKNVAQFFYQPDIDGVLVGNASLNANVFSTIVKIAATCKYFNTK
ncbi:triosephosphate isomerase [Candidatus Pantoea carbekii]|uniref:Triosephosphate isomerase n=1 Tax=Candidatus Pantoea carbekii TaxID=1235990 RepID=U3U8V0_9GAMM|nr:triosephosphate isomerase [Candidatus Pantoea carbekii]